MNKLYFGLTLATTMTLTSCSMFHSNKPAVPATVTQIAPMHEHSPETEAHPIAHMHQLPDGPSVYGVAEGEWKKMTKAEREAAKKHYFTYHTSRSENAPEMDTH